MIRAAGWAALSIALLGAGRLRAQTERRVVFLVRGAPADAVAVEVLARIRGELRGARFDIQPAAQPDGGSPREVVEREAHRAGIGAALGIFFDGAQPEVWVADAHSGRTTVEPLGDSTGGDRRASVLAANAIDLLKATLAEAQPGAPAATAAPPAAAPVAPVVVAATVAVDQPGARRDTLLLLLAGGGWLRAGRAGTLAPTLSLAVVPELPGGLGGRVSVGGLGSSTERALQAGSARVGQGLALIELLACWHPARTSGRSLLACASAGGGAERLRIDGAGAAGFEGTSQSLWAGAATAGASVVWMPGRWLAIGVDARAVGTWPSTNVRIGDATAVRVGGPGVWLTAGVGARL